MIEDLGEGEKGQHEESDVFCTHEGHSGPQKLPLQRTERSLQ